VSDVAFLDAGRCVEPWRLTYAITPPNQTLCTERRQALARAQSALIRSLPVDALLVYDVQDEAARNAAPRPFAFVPKVDPLTYAFEELDVTLPRIVYRAVSGLDESKLRAWLDKLGSRGGRAVLVGAPSRLSSAALTLPKAYSLCTTHAPELPFGGVVIPERHLATGSEDARVWSKIQQGCTFFVSQTVWSVQATKRLLHDLQLRAEREGAKLPPILLTFSPCGSAQTLQFLQWLGVEFEPSLARELLQAKDMLTRSIELVVQTFSEIAEFCAQRGLHVGCNVESVSSRSAEIDASVDLVRRVERLLPGVPASAVLASLQQPEPQLPSSKHRGAANGKRTTQRHERAP
jgi:hypothetical protein